MISNFTINQSCKDMSFNDSWVFIQTVIDLSKCPRCVIEEPAGFSEKDLCLCKCSVLLGDILKQFNCFHKMLGWTSGSNLWFRSAMDKIFLG